MAAVDTGRSSTASSSAASSTSGGSSSSKASSQQSRRSSLDSSTSTASSTTSQPSQAGTSSSRASTAVSGGPSLVIAGKALFKAIKRAHIFRDPALLPTPGVLDFCDGLAGCTGFEGRQGDTVTTKCCLLKRLLRPASRDFFRAVATSVSRLKRWGATLGNASIVRELSTTPSGDTLAHMSEKFWRHAAKMGGYGGSSAKYEGQLLRAFAASQSQGGFGSQPSADAPSHNGSPEQRSSVLSGGLHVCLNYAMEAHSTVTDTGLWLNFPARLFAAVRWWSATHLPYARDAEDKARCHGIACQITGEPCTTPPLAAAAHFVAQLRGWVFGAPSDVHYAAPPSAALMAKEGWEAWRQKHIMRMLICSAQLLRHAECAWDAEAAAGRVAAWRDTGALRAAGGSADARGVAKGPRTDELDEGAADVQADSAASELATAAAIAEAVRQALEVPQQGEGPDFHAPATGATPPQLFALTPHASINVGHARHDKSSLRAHLGKHYNDEVDFNQLLMTGERAAPLNPSFTTDGVVVCLQYTAPPQDPRARAVLGLADPAFVKRKGVEKPGATKKPPPVRKQDAVASMTYLRTLSLETLSAIARLAASKEKVKQQLESSLNAAMTARLNKRKQTADTGTKRKFAAPSLSRDDYATALAQQELTQSQFQHLLSSSETPSDSTATIKPAAAKRKSSLAGNKRKRAKEEPDEEEEEGGEGDSEPDEEAELEGQPNAVLCAYVPMEIVELPFTRLPPLLQGDDAGLDKWVEEAQLSLPPQVQQHQQKQPQVRFKFSLVQSLPPLPLLLQLQLAPQHQQRPALAFPSGLTWCLTTASA